METIKGTPTHHWRNVLFFNISLLQEIGHFTSISSLEDFILTGVASRFQNLRVSDFLK